MSPTTVFEALSVVFAALASARMWISGLHVRYRYLFAYLVFLVPYSVWPILLDIHSKIYFRVWLATEPLNWIFEILVVRELCGLVLERYQGLCTLGRWAMYAGMALSAAISFATLLPRISTTMPQRSLLLFYVAGANRGVNLALAVFLLLMMTLGSRFPLPLSRNVVLSAVLFTLLFLSNTMAMLIHTLFDRSTSPLVDTGLMAVSAASLAILFLALSSDGEAVQVELAHLRPDLEARLLTTLEDLNAMVLRISAA